MRAIRALLVGASVLTASVGTAAASQAMGWERPWAAHSSHSSTLSPAYRGGDEEGRQKDHKDRERYEHGGKKGDEYELIHSCQGKFDYCTNDAVFAPKILGDIGVTTG